MFTGIIETCGTVVRIGSRGDYKELRIKPENELSDIIIGESIAVDGCCLTVTEESPDDFMVEVSPESLKSTIIGDYRIGTKINLERSLLPTTRMGGHFVTGHIDTVGRAVEISKEGNVLELTVKFPAVYAEFLISKGSVAINGISLTVNKVESESFKVNLIPHTRTLTTLDLLKTGDKVNLEFDLIGKYIVQSLKNNNRSSLTLDKLIQSGW
jgi:riboflavin synthase